MKHTLLILLLCISTFSMAQETTTSRKVVGKTELVTSNDHLKELAADVNVKYEAYQKSITGSRSADGEVVKDEYLKSLDTYITALETEVSKSNDQDAAILKEEHAQAVALRNRVRMTGSK
ncbi:hypothetical protein K6119_15740 [Paracrocinitomix mangrovi]|uniref:hypothetical protein n=1 Tax=Paracrocinitomix mangrovi TaxID=2862509 RepID=UPI001C8DB20D|nr:hypothetical protein [Paracrocinitomix mangrovi]UKN01182.1 hypothetical protein K6119_15740 [Paracrocinitomix mangrovi]